MKITKKIEKEILQVMDDYWGSYFQGDLQSWASFLPDDYRNIGTTKAEIWNSKQEIVDFTESVIDQTVGMAEVRNKQSQIIPYDPYVMVHELGDLYVKAEEGWVYYAQFRLSSLLEKTSKGWKILHQHGSFPDAKAAEGEAFGFDELKIENKKLRDAIKSRTIELEEKNRELEIESALQRVRAVAMSMKTSKELQTVGEVIFKELKELGFTHLRNTEIIINQDEKQSILSYYYSDYGVSGQIEVDYTSHPVLKKWAEDLKTAGDGFAGVHISESEMVEWKKYREELGYLPDPKLDEAKSLDYYSYSTGLGALSISTFNPISPEQLVTLERFRNVFGLAYRRYVDVEQAEAQAREVEIQLALERVRAASMAMYTSQELASVTRLFFEQLISLGMEVYRSWIDIIYEEEGYIKTWSTDFAGNFQPTPTIFPLGNGDEVAQFLEDHKSASKFIELEVHGGEVEEWFEVLYTTSSDPIFKMSSYPNDLYQVWAKHKFGTVATTKTSPITTDEKDILARFAQVFEQAYTRFLDLQRAEEQAREAEIEAALERVRGQTMAMHNSEDVGKCTVKMFDELTALGVPENTRFGIGILNHNDENNQLWTAAKDGAEVKMHIGNLDMNLHPLLTSARKAWKKQVPLHTYVLEGEDLQRYYQMLNNAPDYKYRIAIEKLPEREFHYGFIFEHGFFYAFSTREFQPDLIRIIQRFSALFSQTYRRYLDLVKAEQQARKAQIEAALERVRAQTMAMHSSEDVGQCIIKLFNELTTLGVSESTRLGIGILNHENTDIELWTAAKNADGIILHSGSFDMLAHPLLESARNAWVEQKSVSQYILDGKKTVSAYFKVVNSFENYPLKINLKKLPNKIFHYDFAFDQGILYAFCLQPLSDELIAIFRRFSALFEQTYRRYLDLVKAEAQAREAQIEAALEKVRSRSLAVNKSDEFNEVVGVVFEKLSELGMPVGSVTIALTKKGTKDWEVYGCGDGESGLSLIKFTLPYFPNAFSDDIIAAQSGADAGYFSKVYTEEEKNNYYKFAFKNTELKHLPDDLKQRVWQSKSYALSVAYTKNSVIMVNEFEGKVLNEDQAGILKRFSRVFEQTYIRFLDLQKAEEQAREAQIEAALERLRAKAMSMHHSDELDEVLAVLCEQFDVLGIVPMSAHLTVLDIENNKFTFRETGKFGNRSFGEQTVALDAMDTWKDMVESWKNAEPFSINSLHFPKETLPQVWEVFHESFASMPEESRITPDDYPDGIYHTAGKHPFGYIGMNQIRKATKEEEGIVMKFANEFGRAYQRFLDLQRAEAQAREAQIEAALERVRSRSLAMHQSEELGEVVTLLVEQLKELDFYTQDGVALITHLEDSKDLIEWMENPGFPNAINFHLPYFDHPVLSDLWQAKEEGAAYLATRYTAEENESFLNHIFEHSDFKHTPPEVKDYCLAAETYGYTVAFQKNTAIFINDYSGYSLTDDEIDILKRFARVFEQAYIRFLDLQKAEKRARNAQIETALERVSSRAMAMHQSDELVEVAALLRREMGLLGIEELETSSIYIHDDKTGKTECWYSIQDREQEDKLISDHMTIDLKDTWVGQQMLAFYDSDKEKASIVMQGANRTEWIKYCAQQSDSFSIEGFYGQEIPERIYHLYKFSNGYIGAASPGDISAESWNLLRRATAVFSLAYTRFSDLQTAEAQAREAQIELALERARNQSMLMQSSDELNMVSNVFHEQLLLLELPTELSYVWLPDEESKTHLFWVTWSEKNRGTPTSRSKAVTNILDKTEPYTAACYEMWESEQSVFVNRIQPDEVDDFFISWSELLSEAENMKAEYFPDGLYYAEAYMKYGCFGINIRRPLTEEEEKLLYRFSIEFERAYTRFLDLQKAEAQAQEAQIEAALERVRARAMAMHKSDEMLDVADVLFQQLRGLGGNLTDNLWGCGVMICKPDTEDDEVWFANQYGVLPPITMPHTEDPVHRNMYEGWKNKIELYSEFKEGQELKKHYEYMLSVPTIRPIFEKILDSGLTFPTWQKWHAAYFSHGYLLIITTKHFKEEKIFTRFAKVFDQAYIRFLDLQKAEAQAREAQVEAAVERVRSAAMAMHSSDDFSQVAATLWEQVNELKITGFAGTGIALFDKEGYITWWDFSSPGNIGTHEGNINRYEYEKYPLLGKEVCEVYQQGEPYFVFEYDLAKLKRAVKEWEKIKPAIADRFKEAIASGKLTQQWGACGRITNGFLFFDQLLPPDDDSRNILLKMTSAFELAYQRFLDLQKAEAQAREARIETALEKVRSRTMAMRKAEELHEVVGVVVEKLVDLGVVLDANGVILCTYFPDSRDVLHWIASPDFSFTGSYLLPYFDHPIFSATWESKERGDAYFSESFTVEEKNSFFEYAFEHSDYKHFPDEFKEWVFQNDKHSLTFAWSKNSAILIPSHTGVIPTAEEAEILKRFARVFEQAYVRFMDLQKAEMQAKEALKQAALDRVRGEIASMRSTEDLNRITPVIWRELIALDVPFIRCGVFIVDEAAEVVEVYLTTPDGKALGVLHLPFDVNSQTTNTVKYWREKEVYKEHWDAQTFTEWTQSMIEMGQVKNFADYQGSAKVPDELHLHFIPFKQGMLYVGDVNPLPDEKIEMVKTLAEAFSIAYARYEDFVRLEQAKSKVEAALAELKSTQAQLIQSEKMASLGELTAGIAHEIQNPLNFVNNFSEVSTELLDEMNEEITKGDLEEAIAIANDIKQNLEKINQHGQRADAIVKGMLQHSRKSTAEKALTDINKLADEYLRLAYHGLRAKDKTFNATLETSFDPDLEQTMVIPQDIGRVVLNLFNNAFYAVNEKKKERGNGYQPTVSISTSKQKDHIVIAVKDNGNGIPKTVLDKIFQPFFTTKPTGQGTGLGLSLSYDIIKAHGGALEVTTEEGAGTTFTIAIPNIK